jgi:transcriptional regulator with PAS, ATPase and Fis domain
MLNKKVEGFAGEAMQLLLDYSWPGNVRELQNLIERVVVLSRGETITKEELPIQCPSAAGSANADQTLKEMVINYEKDTIKEFIAANKDNISQAAKDLNMARTSLISRMKALDMNLKFQQGPTRFDT